MNDRRWIILSLAVASFGLLLYVLGIVIGGEGTFTKLMEDVGSAMVIAAAIAFLIERRTHAAMFATVDEAAKRMHNATLLTRGAASLDIEGIFVRRGTVDERQECTDAVEAALADAIERSLPIDILCVAGPDFFKSDGTHSGLLWTKLTAPGNKTTMRVVLLDPDSPAGKEQASLEIGHTTNADIRAAGDTLNSLYAATSGRVSHRYHDSAGANFLIITEHTLFHEAYPTAVARPPAGPIGGHVALLQYKKTSRGYDRWRKHFDHVWGQARAPGTAAATKGAVAPTP